MLKIKIQNEVFINLPTEEIFAYMSDLGNLVDWSSVIIAVKKNSPGAIGVGTTMQGTVRFLGKWLDITFEVVEYEPDRYLTLKSISGGAPCLFCYRLEPVEGGGTTASQEAVIDIVGGILNLTEPVVTRAVHRQLECDLLTLKDMLEDRSVQNS